VCTSMAIRSAVFMARLGTLPLVSILNELPPNLTRVCPEFLVLN
jgi:hypothetical protein